MRKLILALVMVNLVAAWCAAEEPPRMEELHNKTILVFTPHPDDDGKSVV